MKYHEDKNIGVVMRKLNVKEIHNAHGQHYWLATAPIGSIFGAEVDGELKGIGRTRAEALARLAEEEKKLADSLWA